MTALMYGTVRFGGSVAGATVSAASELASGRLSLPPVWSTSRGRYVQSILNGVWGDSLEGDKSPLRVELGLRDPDGNQHSTSKEALSRLFPNATSRLVVLVHGLAETERCWQPSTGSALPEGLEDDGFSVLRLRYNTGRAVADNGSELADLLDEIRQEWPVPVEEIVLVGHSMGGLVAQSAVIAALTRRLPWGDLATHIVAIGTPHLGSPIEKGVDLVGRFLGVFEVTRPLREFLEGRSAGIKDLRHGADNRPNGLAYHVVAGVVTKEPTHLLGALVGDLVVQVSSAVGGGGTPSSNVLVVGGRQHADLPGDPDVATHIRGWLSQQSMAPTDDTPR